MSKDAEIVVKVAQVDGLEGHIQLAGERASLISATVREPVPQFCAAAEARSRAEVALPSSESQLQVVCASESSIQEEVDQLQSGRPVWRSSVIYRLCVVIVHKI